MIYQTGGMTLRSAQVIMRGEINDIEVCQDITAPSRPFYVLVSIKKRKPAKKVLSILYGGNTSGNENSYIKKVFSLDTKLCFLFDYRPERPLKIFGDSQMFDPRDREQVCVNIIIECLSIGLPFPLLYLLLCDESINILKDNSVFFSPYMDFSLFDPGIKESDCVKKCLDIVLNTLRGSLKKPLKSFELLNKKKLSGAYQSFTELYKDILHAALPVKKNQWKRCWTLFAETVRDPLFRLLLVFCIVVFFFAFIVLISQLFFGDVPLFRLFSDSFKVIGTERLG